MKIAISLAVVLAAAFVSPMFAPGRARPVDVPDVVSAKRFELIDQEGRVRIEMRMDENQPVVAIKDEQGRDRVLVFHQDSASGVYIKDADEHTRIGLAQFPHGGGVAMHGAEGKGSAVFVLMNKKARLDVYDEAGTLTNRWPR